MRIVQVVNSMMNQAAGPSYSVQQLSEALARAGAVVELHSIGGQGAENAHGVTHRRFGQDAARIPGLAAMRASRGLQSALNRAAAG